MEKEKYVISKLPGSRWQECKNLRLEALKTVPLAFGSSYEAEKDLTDQDWKNRIHNALFALDGNEPVGMIVLIVGSDHKTRHIATIYSLYIKLPFRGKGIGFQLMKSAIASLKGREYVKKIKLAVNVEQKAAIRLYEKFGFIPAGTLHQEIFHEGNYYDELIMELFL